MAGTQLADAYVQVVPSMKGVQTSIASSFGSAGDAGGKIAGDRARGGILKGAVTAGAGFLGAFGVAKVAGKLSDGLGTVVGKGLDRAVSIQNAQKKLEGLGHSAESITKIMGSALASVKGTSFGLGDAATVAASAVAAGIKPGKQLTAYLKTTADTATIAGGSLSDIGAILNKANTGTAVYSDTLNQLSDRGIPVFTLLAKHYGVTQAKFQDMVKHGEVDGATLGKVLHDKIGGAALDSGKTAVGAYANIGAAFGRLGVQLGAGTAVGKAPALFSAIATAVDDGAAALKPLTDIINDQLGAALDGVTKYISNIDFTKIGAQVKVLAGNVKGFLAGFQGTSTPGLDANGYVVAGTKIRGVLTSVLGVVHGFVSGAKTALGSVFGGKGLDLSGFSQLGPLLANIGTVVKPLGPALLSTAKSSGGLAKSIGDLIAAGIPILPPVIDALAGAVKLVADHMDVLAPLIPVIAAGFVAYRIASKGSADAVNVLHAAQVAALPASIANNLIQLATARSQLAVARANGQTTGSILLNTAANVRQGIAYAVNAAKTAAVTLAQKAVAGAQAVASLAVGANTRAVVANGIASAVAAGRGLLVRGAMLAGAAATGVATAAQWLLNAALDANPIGIIVVAIAALVAGLVYFFTQTKVGQAAWSAFTGFLTQAWANVVSFFQTAIAAVVGFFTQFGPVILAVVAPFIGLPLLIISHWGQIVAFFTELGAKVIAILAGAGKWLLDTGGKLLNGLLQGAIGALMGLGRWELSILNAVVGALAGAGKWLLDTGTSILHGLLTGAINALVGLGRWELSIFNAVRGALSGAATWLVSTGAKVLAGLLAGGVAAFRTIAGFVTSVRSTFTNALSAAGTWLLSTGKFIVDGLVQGVRGAIGGAVSAVKGLINLLPQGVRDILGIHSPSTVFAAIGKYIGTGLVKGLSGTADQVKTATTDLASKVTDAFTNLTKNRTAAQKRLKTLDTELTKNARSIATAQDRLDAARSAKHPKTATINAAERTLANAKDQRKSIKASIKDQRSIIASANAAPKGKAKSNLLTAISKDNASLNALAVTRDQLASDLSDAQSKLTDAVKVRDDFRDSVQQTSIDLGNVVTSFSKVVDARKTAADSISDLTDSVSDAVKAQADAQADADSTQADIAKTDAALQAMAGSTNAAGDAIATLQQRRLDLAGNLTSQLAKVADLATKTSTAQANLAKAQTDATQASTPAILQTLQQAVADTNAFQSVLAQLKGQGIDQTTYSQLVSAGVSGGGLQAAQELAAAGSGVVQQVAGLQQQLSQAGLALGTDTSTVMYQAGVDIAQSSVDGIKAKIVDNQAAIALMQTALAASISQLGINTRPLMANAGKQVAAGLADGIYGAQSDLDKVISQLGTATVKALKKKLGIKSPSRVVRNEVGRQVGAGYVLGIQDTYGDAERASNGLAAIPGKALADAGFDDLGQAPAPITQVFTGPMGYTKDEVADNIATKGRRALAGVNIPKVRVG